MTPAQFIRLGREIYAERGVYWKDAFSKDAGINIRRVHRWAAGKTAIPDWLEDRMRELAERRARKIAQQAARRADRLNALAEKA